MHTCLSVSCRKFEDINRMINPLSQSYRKKNNQAKKNKVAHHNRTPQKNLIFQFLCVIQRIRFLLFKLNAKPPRIGKYAVQNTSLGNQGSATIEAVCIMPLMLFAFWAFYSMGQIYIMENQVYQAVLNTADYMAETAYLLEEGTSDTEVLELGTAVIKLRYYLEDSRRVEQYVVGGINGLLITNSEFLDEEDFVCLKVQYRIRIPVPLLHDFSVPVCAQIRQKAYTGYQESYEFPEEECYVYIAEHSTVYHLSRNCSHLKLTIIPVSSAVIESSYSELRACEYCGDATAAMYYITPTGDCYHTSTQCTGLKRTVRRVKLSEVQGYAPCSRCGQ